MLKTKTTLLLLPTLTLLLLVACSSIDCPLNNKTMLKSGFYSLQGDSVVLADTVTISTRPTTDPTDTVLVNRLTQAHDFSLPLSYSAREDVFYVHFWGADYHLYDTVRVVKESVPHFESPDCDPRFFHTIVSVQTTHNAIDSIAINNKSVDYDTTSKHFKIYLHSSY